MATNFCKLVTDIVYEGYDEWWSIEKIAAKTIDMEYEKFMDKKVFPEGARNIICSHIKTFIPHVHTLIREKMESLLLSEVIEGRRCYKCAVIGDEPYILKFLKTRKRLDKRAVERFNKMLDNIKQNKLLPDTSI